MATHGRCFKTLCIAEESTLWVHCERASASPLGKKIIPSRLDSDRD